jgi:hypothetical protein
MVDCCRFKATLSYLSTTCTLLPFHQASCLTFGRCNGYRLCLEETQWELRVRVAGASNSTDAADTQKININENMDSTEVKRCKF